MEPEPEAKPAQAAPTKSYVSTWDNFYEKGLQILASQPVRGRFSLKYNPKFQTIVLKITDGKRIVMKKCKAKQEILKVEKFAELAVQVMTNEAPKKKQVHEDKAHHKDKDKKKKDKKSKQ